MDLKSLFYRTCAGHPLYFWCAKPQGTRQFLYKFESCELLADTAYKPYQFYSVVQVILTGAQNKFYQNVIEHVQEIHCVFGGKQSGDSYISAQA